MVLLTAAFALSRVASGFAAERDIDIADRVQKIDSYVRKIEQNQTLVRKEVKLDSGALKDVTEEKWAKLDAYSRGDHVVRLKVYPAEGTKTEEYYYRKGKLVYVFVEPAGAGKQGHDPNAQGTKYYFKGSKLIAVNEDGKTGSVNEEARNTGAKLLRESNAFLAAAK